MANEILSQSSNVVPFIPGYRPPLRLRIQPAGLAVFEIQQATHDLSAAVSSAVTVDEALGLRRMVAGLVKALNDVEDLANVRALQIVDAERNAS